MMLREVFAVTLQKNFYEHEEETIEELYGGVHGMGYSYGREC